MSFLLGFLLSFTASGADITWLYLPGGTPVFAKPGTYAQWEIIPGEKVILRRREEVYTRIQIRRDGKWKTAYVETEAVDRQLTLEKGQWGYGGGGMYTWLKQAGKTFETEDDVERTTDPFSSQSFSPFLVIQYKRSGFWRFVGAYRTTNFTSRARANLPGAQWQDLTLKHSMLSGTLQKLWSSKGFYYGAGAEISRSVKAELMLDHRELPVASQDLPTYFGGQLLAGGQWFLGKNFSAFCEARVMAYPNQKPVVWGYEAAAGLLYWP